LRLGIYFNLTEKWKRESGQNTTTGQKFVASIIAGGFGSFCGNPADLALVRLQADSSLPVAERRNYKSALDAFSRIIADEGVPSLWKGAVPTMTRAIALNCAQLVSYETVKESLTTSLKNSSALTIQIYASLVSSVFTAFFSLPFDNLKTKLQKQKANSKGILPYKGMLDCIQVSLAREGVTGFWAGLPTYYFRVGPHAIITLLALEQYKRLLGVGKK